MAFRKENCSQPIPRPRKRDVIIDDNDPSKWMTQEDGTPWRGKHFMKKKRKKDFD